MIDTNNMKAVILAAGRGTRIPEITKEIPADNRFLC